ncbi:ATP-binding cassette domain-containing protein [Kocuria soli]|uniref:ABC-type quaternary amine transporter n=1 Tax=Kocuria soli TaxID=2485125 RepID=A0A3N3ZPB9_9MICC|nr:ABC transporter ATP-binding protein [Kocuria soli]ROZ62813.1 ATP-binding cassette domain-containing protein [Kocuria soli]
MSESTTAPTEPGRITGVPILLDGVTKRYGSKSAPAVDHLTLEIPAGSTVMFVGPSGCGKTTTMKMINRLIEPTEGSIVIDGEDVTTMNGDDLRRRMGYVIQAGGLFPHMTVAANIGLVPKMLGWDKQRIAERVDELLELVSLDPDSYRDRYPKQLSGGQQQRVGVARALAADPPVLLMDEPFGAVDPITRQRLQDEMISIQNELRKTIVIVTHDIDEAVKLGDWVVVFDEGARIQQYDSPERILAEPANDFVSDFVGSGAGLKALGLTRVNEMPILDAVVVTPEDSPTTAVQKAEAAGHGHVVVLDRARRPIAWPSVAQLRRATALPTRYEPDLPIVGMGATLEDALDTMLVSRAGAALVVGPRGRFEGVVDIDTVMQSLRDNRGAADTGRSPVGTNDAEARIEVAPDTGEITLITPDQVGTGRGRYDDGAAEPSRSDADEGSDSTALPQTSGERP